MKKITLLVSLIAMALGVQALAEKISVKTDGVVMPSSSLSKLSSLPKQNNLVVSKAPNGKPMNIAADLASNEKIIGLWTSDDYDKTGLNLTKDIYPTLSPNKSYKMVTTIPTSYYEKVAKDAKLTSVRVALAAKATISKVLVYNLKDDQLVTLAEQDVNQSCEAGWTTFKLNESLDLPVDGEGLCLGYEFKLTPKAEKPISVNPNFQSGYSWMIYGNFDEAYGEDWYAVFSQYGALCVQGIIECDNLPSVDIVLQNFDLSTYFVQNGVEFKYGFTSYNFGTATVNNFEIELFLDDVLFKTLTEKDYELGGNPYDYIGTITLPESTARGEHSLRLKVKSVNGSPVTENVADDVVALTFTSYMSADVVERQKYLVEEITSNTCVYCPYGTQILDKMKELNKDLAIACIHGNLSGRDPFNSDECEQLFRYLYKGIDEGIAFPSGSFNRMYYGKEDGITPGIGYDPQYQDEIADVLVDNLVNYSDPVFASVDIETVLDSVNNKLKINVTGKGGEMAKEYLKKHSLTVYIIEEGLKYRQNNLGVQDDNYIHNHVLRDVVTAINGDNINWTSNSEYSNTFNVDFNEKWNKDNVYVIAFISKRQELNHNNFSELGVSNANMAKLTDVYLNNGGGNGGNTDDPTQTVEANLVISAFNDSYQLICESASPNMKYLAGFNFVGYAPAIWNIETGVINTYSFYEEGTFHAINNHGLAVGSDGKFALAIKANGDEIELYSKREGEKIYNEEFDFYYEDCDAGSEAYAVSEDGKTIAGFYFDAAYKTTPCYWNENGERFDLPIPTEEEFGYPLDGAEVRWMTPDAKVMLGFLFDDFSTWPAVLWRLNSEGVYEYEVICKDYFEAEYGEGKPYMLFNPTGLSENGEWVSLSVQGEFDMFDWDTPAPSVCAARLNLKTNKLEVLNLDESFNGVAMASTSISNDGNVIMYTETGDIVFGRIGYLWPSGENSKLVCLDDLMATVKGMPKLGSNSPVCISADSEKIMGFLADASYGFHSYVFDYKVFDGIDQIVADDNVIRKDSRIFNIYGQQLNGIKAPGLYVVDGKKVIIRK